MSHDEVASQVLANNGILPDEGTDDQQAPAVSGYHLVGSASIPVSKKAGTRWETLIKDSLEAYDGVRNSWDKGYLSYRLCSNSGEKLNASTSSDQPSQFFQNDTDENLTRENVKTLLRTSYQSNPTINLATIDESEDDVLDTYKAVINQLLNRVNAPGLNGKARIRRWIMHGHITNFGILKLDYQAMQGSRQEAQANLLQLQEKISKAKDDPELDELYAELEQAEEELSTTRDSGMCLENTNSMNLVIDTSTTYLDLSDCQWTAEKVMLKDSYIRKRYMKKNEDGVWVSIVSGKPVKGNLGDGSKGEKDIRETVADKVLGATTEAVAKAKYKDCSACWIIFDKLTKQIGIWLDGSWDAPLFVWMDDLKLSRFFPYFLIAFTEPVENVVQEGEQAQYAGIEREINKINKRVSFIRRLAYGSLIWNTRKMPSESADKILQHMKNPEEFDGFGVDWDPAMKLKDMFDVFVPPDSQISQLYDKTELMKVANRVNSQSEVSSGGQFKTNTTNKAVAAYQQQAATVKNELTDAIEDAMSDLVWAMLEIVASKYSKQQISQLVGATLADAFEPMSVEEFNATYSCTIAPGSTEKPSSDNMKQEAMQIAQAVGQVGQSTPMTSLKIIFRMFSKAFSSFLFTKDDEKMLAAEAQANMQKGVSTPGTPPQGTPPGGPPVKTPAGGPTPPAPVAAK